MEINKNIKRNRIIEANDFIRYTENFSILFNIFIKNGMSRIEAIREACSITKTNIIFELYCNTTDNPKYEMINYDLATEIAEDTIKTLRMYYEYGYYEEEENYIVG